MSEPLNAPASQSSLPNEVILASAGSGKTFALSGRYLALVARGADPTRILSSTFARGAAGEIRTRIVQRAAEAAEDAAARARLGAAIGVELDETAAHDLLRRLVSAWGDLQIATLDSVMARIVTAHALRLGLPPKVAMVDPMDESALRDKTLHELLDEDPDRTISLFRELTAGKSETRIAATIDAVLRSMVGLSHEATADAWEFLRAPRRRRLDLDAALAQIEAVSEHGGKQVAKAIAGHVAAARAGAWDQIVANGIGKNLLAGKCTYSTKEIPEEVVEAMEPILLHAVGEMIDVIVRRTRASAAIVRRFVELWRARMSADGRIVFADLPVLVRELDLEAARLQERIGPLPQHLLLDEMQDTSVAQWEALRPLVDAALADGGSAFAVGDVKQSIYGWRGGVPEVLESLPARFGVEAGSLTTTYRCRPAVVSAVNTLFGAIAPDAEEAAAKTPGPLDASTGARRFRRLFEPHRAHLIQPSFAWTVCPCREPAAPLTKPARVRLVDDAVAALAARMSEKAPRATVGILTRDNKTVARLLARLGPGGAGLDVSARGGTSLGDAPPVETVMSVLRLAEHPDDTVAAFHVARSPLGRSIGLGEDAWQAQGVRRDASARLRARVHRDGLPAVVRWLVASAAAHASVRELRRLVRLAEMAAAGDGTTERFIELVAGQAVADESAARIRIMTIHQSKGLDFDLVIIPNPTGPLTRTDRILAAERRRPQDHRVDAIIRWVAAEHRAVLPPDAHDVFESHHARLEFDAICLLYVAMTRARHGLVSIVPPWMKRDREVSAATIFAHHLRAGRRGDDDAADWPLLQVAGTGADGARRSMRLETLHMEDSEGPCVSGQPLACADSVLDWLAAHQAVVGETDAGSVAAATVPAANLPTTLRPARRPPRAGTRPPSSGAGTSLADPFRGDLAVRREAAAAGSAWHAVLEMIEWIDDLDALDDSRLARAIHAAVRGRDDRWVAAVVGAARTAVGRPALRALFTRPPGPVHATVHREWPFVRRTRDGLQRGTIDRLILFRDDSAAVVGAEIVDFKTGDASGTDQQLADRYRTQLNAYAETVAERHRLDERSIRKTLAFVEADRTVEVG